MPIVTRPFEGVRAGEIYPVVIEVGDECPPELLAAAIALGCVDVADGQNAGDGDDTDQSESDQLSTNDAQNDEAAASSPKRASKTGV